MNAHQKRIIRKIVAPLKRVNLSNRDFSIISNNCWGGIVYDIFGLKYRTPFIGCYIMPEDYIKLLKNLHYYMSLDCKEIDFQKSKFFDKEKKIVPIGQIDDIQICFVHYDSGKIACDKWNKRKLRIDYDNLLIKFSDQNGCTISQGEEFLELPFKNKIFITNKGEFRGKDNVVLMSEFKNQGYVIDDIKPSFKYINLKKILNELIDK